MPEAPPSPEDILLLFVTVPDADIGSRMGRALVEERLAACVTLVPGTRSIYRWQGALQDDTEVLCLIKTRRSLFDRLRQRVESLHPYQVPEIIGVAPACGNASYLHWVWDSTAGSP
jgi:periplasmic divalent cation tolerance protein